MPERRTVAKPQHAAAKATMVDAGSLRVAWGLAWLLDPSHAVGLVVQARRILRSGPTTRAWFEEGLGGEVATIGGLLDLFWPNPHELEQLSNSTGYSLGTSHGLAFKHLLKALGRPEWIRAEASLTHYRGGIVRTTTRYNAKGNLVKHRKKLFVKNARQVDIDGVAQFWTMTDEKPTCLAHKARAAGFRRYNLIYTPKNASSIPCLILYRHTVAQRLQALRLAFHTCGATPPPCPSLGKAPGAFNNTPEQAAAAALAETNMEKFPLGDPRFAN